MCDKHFSRSLYTAQGFLAGTQACCRCQWGYSPLRATAVQGERQVESLFREAPLTVNTAADMMCGNTDLTERRQSGQNHLSVGPEPSGGPPDTGAERNKGLLNFGRENILLQAQESPPAALPLFIPAEETKLNSIPRAREVRSIRPSADLRCNHETHRSTA
ncbi:unnamed protein product [Pleuronectes platessa]|uniref:Uncharacterized protein n=1 Tax=Pleuronectes platessa TaxID=8262 RepID=A0A9N7ZA80_PLEPL|nr:unnamed protein product [Pleuronectes platessa]